MSGSIRLHPELGVNPRLAFCPRCGEDTNDVLLLGATNRIYRCQGCDTPNVGKPKDGCGRCGHYDVPFERELGPSEKLPGSICDPCKEELQTHQAEVEAGGVFFKCSDCPTTGVIKAGHPFAEKVREHHGIKAPGICGVEFSKAEGCPSCSGT